MTPEEQYWQLVADYKGTFGTDEGKRVLAHLRMRCGVDDVTLPTGNDGHIDSHHLAANQGRKAVYVEIMNHVDKDVSEQKQTDAINEDEHE